MGKGMESKGVESKGGCLTDSPLQAVSGQHEPIGPLHFHFPSNEVLPVQDCTTHRLGVRGEAQQRSVTDAGFGEL